MARIRNTKKLGQRVNRTYLKRVYPIPQWRRILTFVFIAASLAWLGFHAVAHDQTPYTAGPLTAQHAFLGKKCAVCHGENVSIGKRVADPQCAACHDGPIHQASQTFNPACISCHVEHRGTMRLAGTADSGCVQCHGNLQTQTGKLTIAASVKSFDSHPEFGSVVSGKDASGLKFNHQKHIGEVGQKCADCHTPAEGAKGAPHSHVSPRAFMTLPTYEGTCMPCHALTIDDKIADPLPHKKQPDELHPMVEEQFRKYIAAHPGDLGKDGTPAASGAWVAFKVAAAEKKLQDETCARCHAVVAGADFASAVIVPPQVPSRWYTKASFDHSAHKELTCISCHVKAPKSTVSSDILVPGIAVCRDCHSSGSSSAGSNCSTCHIYHDWTKEKPVDGKYMIEQMTRSTAPHSMTTPPAVLTPAQLQ